MIKGAIISAKELERMKLRAMMEGFAYEPPDSEQRVRVRHADQILGAILENQASWGKVFFPCDGADVAIVGAGPSITKLKPEHFKGISAVFGCNSATNGIPKLDIPVFGVHSDEMPVPEVRVPTTALLLGCMNVRLHPFHPNIIMLPDVPILRPIGCQALCAWIARLAGARSLTMLCCDSVINIHDRWEEIEPVSYSWHPGCTLTIACGLPITWKIPGYDGVIEAPRPHRMLWGTLFEHCEPSTKTLHRGGM